MSRSQVHFPFIMLRFHHGRPFCAAFCYMPCGGKRCLSIVPMPFHHFLEVQRSNIKYCISCECTPSFISTSIPRFPRSLANSRTRTNSINNSCFSPQSSLLLPPHSIHFSVPWAFTCPGLQTISVLRKNSPLWALHGGNIGQKVKLIGDFQAWWALNIKTSSKLFLHFLFSILRRRKQEYDGTSG